MEYGFRIAYAKASRPTAQTLADTFYEAGHQVQLYRDNDTPVDINWGRAKANAKLNPDISNVTNKRRMRQLFRAHDVPMPLLVDPGRLSVFEVPVIGRPDKHSQGRGFWRCTSWRDVQRALRGTRTKRAATHFMEEIQGAEHEYRVHIFKGKSLRISEKRFTGELLPNQPNHRIYTTIKPRGPVDHVREAAKSALCAVGLDFGAVDILATDTRCWVLEVNAAPGLGGSMPEVYVKAFTKWKSAQ